MTKSKYTKTALIMLVLIWLSAVSVASRAPVAARAVHDTQLSVLYGGDWECYCEIDSYTCNSSPGTNCSGPLTDGAYCARCTKDAATEKCVGAGVCIPWITCTDCVGDAPHDCGMETEGSCSGTQCLIDDTGIIPCGSANQCHTS